MSTALITLEQYKGKANVLVPTQHIQQVSPWHAARISEVVINPDPLAGDVFKVGSRFNEQTREYEDLFSPAKPALMKIASAAGIVWNWKDSGPEALTRDYVVYKAVGAIRLPDGSWQPIMARKEIDLSVIEEETLEANLKKSHEYAQDDKKRSYLKGLTPQQWAEQQTKSAMIQWRKNKLGRAETGAMLRVIRAALGMKSQYTRAELSKPFIVPRIDWSPDYGDPEVRHALIQHGAQAMAGLFGQSTPATPFALPPGQTPAERAPFEAAGSEPDDDADAVETIAAEVSQAPAGGAGEAAEDSAQATTTGQQTLLDPQQQPSGNGGQVKPAFGVCADCGSDITAEKVVNYSRQKYGRPLCYRCQKGGTQA